MHSLASRFGFSIRSLMVDLSFLSFTLCMDAAHNCPCTKRSITEYYCIHHHLHMERPSHAQIKLPSPWFVCRFESATSSLVSFFFRNLIILRYIGHVRLQVTPVWINRLNETNLRHCFFYIRSFRTWSTRLYRLICAGQQEIVSWRSVFSVILAHIDTHSHTPSFANGK